MRIRSRSADIDTLYIHKHVSKRVKDMHAESGTDDDNKGMLFDGEFSWVDIERQLSQRYPPTRKLFPCPTDRKNEKLGYNIADSERRLTAVSVETLFSVRMLEI